MPPPSTLTPLPAWLTLPIAPPILLALTVALPPLPNSKWMPSPDSDHTVPLAVMFIDPRWELKCFALIAARDLEVTVPVVVMLMSPTTVRAHIA